MYLVIICFPVNDVINFEINPIIFKSSRFTTWPKSQNFIIFKWLPVATNILGLGVDLKVCFLKLMCYNKTNRLILFFSVNPPKDIFSC